MSLGEFKDSTKFTTALRPFFNWCWEVFLFGMSARDVKALTALSKHKTFHINLLVHHRPLKLWEQYAFTDTHEVYGVTQTRHPLRHKRHNVATIQLPIYLLFDGPSLALVFIHEMAHAVRHRDLWVAMRRRHIRPTVNYSVEWAEDDAQLAENTFVSHLADYMAAKGTPPQRESDLTDYVKQKWLEVLRKHPQVQKQIAAASLHYDNHPKAKLRALTRP